MKPPTRPAPTLITQAQADALRLSRGELQGAVLDLTGVSDGTPLGVDKKALSPAQVQDKWGFGQGVFEKVKALAESERQKIRGLLTDRAMIVAGCLQNSLMNDLVVFNEDGTVTESEAMKKMTPEQKARMMKHVTDAAVTFQDGHAQAGGSFDPIEMMRLLDERRAQRPVILPPANAS